MKANEAPEKIYCTPTAGGFYLTTIKPETPFAEGVEYTRTDAFIEKAFAYLNEKFYFNNAFYGVVSTDFNAIEELFEDFKKYMKGEKV